MDSETRMFTVDGQQKTLTVSKIFDNTDFGFHKITVDRPLRLNFQASEDRIARLDEESGFKNLATSNKKKEDQRLKEIEAGKERQEALRAFLRTFGKAGGQKVYKDRKDFLAGLKEFERPAVNASEVATVSIPFPTLAEQRSIAEFLDKETAKLDTLVAKKRELIEKLKEKRTAIISRTITRGLPLEAARAAGLNPHPKLKPSSIEWLGEIPEHWESGNLRRYAQMKTGHTPSRQNAEYWEDCTIPWFTLADVWQLRDEKQKYLAETKEKISEVGLKNSAAELLPAGTVVFSRTASIGFSGIMPAPMTTTQDFWNWVCGKKLLPEYLLLVFRAMKQEFARRTMGSTHKTIYQPDAATLCVCVPPLNEQRAIADYLDRETWKIDRMVEKVEVAIERLQEYRTALITTAVTGKIDVRSRQIETREEVPS